MMESYGKTREFFVQRGFSGRVGFGARPALLIIDFIRGFTERESPLSGDLDSSVISTQNILRLAREVSIPIYFTTVEYAPDMKDAGLFPLKIPSLQWLVQGSRWVEVDDRLAPQPDEIVVRKKYASAFFGTDLATSLASKKIDTLIITGCTTSGCVRASVVDALQHGFHAIIPAEAVGDRAQLSHEVSLLDLDTKYGDVVSVKDVLHYLDALKDEPKSHQHRTPE